MRFRVLASVILLLLGMFSLSACNSYEGSGSKDAASAEQLALTTEDPWDKEITQSAQSSSLTLKDGSYTGTAAGVDGLVSVTLEIKDSIITCTQITQDGEAQSVGGFEAIRDGKYAKMIDAAQGSDIDSIAGATLTTAAIKGAVDDALEQAQK